MEVSGKKIKLLNIFNNKDIFRSLMLTGLKQLTNLNLNKWAASVQFLIKKLPENMNYLLKMIHNFLFSNISQNFERCSFFSFFFFDSQLSFAWLFGSIDIITTRLLVPNWFWISPSPLLSLVRLRHDTFSSI